MDRTVQEILKEARDHKNYWSSRNDKFEEWFNLVTLSDADIYQEDMECVISNDPKTFYKKALRILSAGVTHSIPTDMVAEGQLIDVSSVIRFLENQWSSREHSYRRRGRHSWLLEFVGLLLITGWYDVLAYGLPSDGLVAEVRNPAECFPKWDDEELVSHFHIYTITGDAANKRCKRKGWNLEQEFRRDSNVTVYDWWFVEDSLVKNTIVMDTKLVKPETKMQFNEIPIICGPTGGLPDRGSIIPGDDEWQGRVGESIVADNAELYKNFNKHLTFIQQMVRDTAQSIILEKSSSISPVVTPETIFIRGAIFRMTPEESVERLGIPALPVELSTHGRDLEGMLQRGSFPWTMYGGMAGAITSYTMSQITAAAKEILSPYADSMKYVLAEVSNVWLKAMRTFGMAVDDWQLPDNFPPFLKVKVDVPVSIPGDFVQRATLSRMVSPDFRLSTRTTMELLWSEIKDPMREMAAARADDAMQHPVAKTISLISSYRTQAAQLREQADTYGADLFDKAADAAEATLGGMLQAQPGPGPRVEPRPEVLPRGTVPGEELL